MKPRESPAFSGVIGMSRRDRGAEDPQCQTGLSTPYPFRTHANAFARSTHHRTLINPALLGMPLITINAG